MANIGRDRSDEATPLLAEDSGDYDGRANSDIKMSPADQGGSSSNRLFERTWRWLQNNIKILALTGLLLGGVIALIVFIARIASPLVLGKLSG